MTTPPPSPSSPLALLREEQQRALSEHLSKLTQLKAWLQAPLPPDLLLHLREQQRCHQTQLLDLLESWSALGGEVELCPLTQAPRGLLAPETEPQPASQTARQTDRQPASQSPSPASSTPARSGTTPPAPRTSRHRDTTIRRRKAHEPIPSTPAPLGLEKVTEELPRSPAPAASIDQLRSHFQGPAPSTPPPTQFHISSDWVRTLRRQLSALEPGKQLFAERSRLLSAAANTESWVGMPLKAQQHLLGLVTCRLRALQGQAQLPDRELDRAFGVLTEYSRREQPGWVLGLQRDHRPEHGSWWDDAHRHWDALDELLPATKEASPNREKLLSGLKEQLRELEQAPAFARDSVLSQTLSCLRSAIEGGVSSNDPGLLRLAGPLLPELKGSAFRRLRRAIRDDIERRNLEPDPTDSGPLPSDWPLYKLTQGRRAVMVGGDPREPNRLRIERSFGFSELKWEAVSKKPQALQGLQGRILGGSVEMLIILGSLVGHDYDRILIPACKSAGVPYVHVDHGYGVTRIRACMERYLSADSPEPERPSTST